MQSFRAAVEANDPDAIVACLAEDVVFSSPLVFKPYRGRAAVGTILRCVARVFADFRYTDELASPAQTALVFEARVGDKQLQGVDLVTVDAHGRVSGLTVFVRPLTAAMALGEAMRAELAKAGIA